LTYPHWHLEGRRSGPEIDAHLTAQVIARTGRLDFIMAEVLVLADLLLMYRGFLDRGAGLSRRPGFLFYDWLRHVDQVPLGPEGVLRESYRENPESEGVEGSLLSDREEEEGSEGMRDR